MLKFSNVVGRHARTTAEPSQARLPNCVGSKIKQVELSTRSLH